MPSFSFPVHLVPFQAGKPKKFGIFVEECMLVKFGTFSCNYKFLALFPSFPPLSFSLQFIFVSFYFSSSSINKKISKLGMVE